MSDHAREEHTQLPTERGEARPPDLIEEAQPETITTRPEMPQSLQEALYWTRASVQWASRNKYDHVAVETAFVKRLLDEIDRLWPADPGRRAPAQEPITTPVAETIARHVSRIRVLASKTLGSDTEDIVLAACDTIDQATWGVTVTHG